ncbi:hypothetical protein FSP39_012063 [Pinctada imbricata]|uniref:Transmembrane protein 107 n=1 Tax=Pinctada imbricata TaxID=66713 RepID=A0AA88YPL8_PINIB|nr:hypothetical protein FSP39_012063 [Pinctada imbricata]
MRISGIVPARFLTIVGHIVILIVLFWSKERNVRECLPVRYTQSEYDAKDQQLLIGISVGLGLMLLELIGFIAGVSMFMPFQSMLSTACHMGAVLSLTLFLFEYWPCDDYWFIFGFCSAFPAFTEILLWIGVACFNKGL